MFLNLRVAPNGAILRRNRHTWLNSTMHTESTLCPCVSCAMFRFKSCKLLSNATVEMPCVDRVLQEKCSLCADHGA